MDINLCGYRGSLCVCIYIGYIYVYKKRVVATEHQLNENFYLCYISEPAAKLKICL